MRRVALACTLLTFASCQVFRPIYRDWKNADLKGQVAPPLTGGTWVPSTMQDGDSVPPGWQPAASRWRMLVFFLPD